MTHTTTVAHVPAISAHVREETGNQLQATLVELLDLSLVGKQLHWSIVGSHFRPLHEQLLLGVVRKLEEQLWMIRSQIPNGAT